MKTIQCDKIDIDTYSPPANLYRYRSAGERILSRRIYISAPATRRTAVLRMDYKVNVERRKLVVW